MVSSAQYIDLLYTVLTHGNTPATHQSSNVVYASFDIYIGNSAALNNDWEKKKTYCIVGLKDLDMKILNNSIEKPNGFSYNNPVHEK